MKYSAKDIMLDCILKVIEVVWYASFAALMIIFVIPLAMILMGVSGILETCYRLWRMIKDRGKSKSGIFGRA